MNFNSPFMPSFDQLPTSLPIFPLSNTILLPGCQLPLNIFEPRYLNMVRDTMRNDQLLGIIQPSNESSPPSLYDVGGAGRVTQYEELNDGRLKITLTGVARFTIADELTTNELYRIVTPAWQPFASDFTAPPKASSASKLKFNAALKHYFTSEQIEVNWHEIEKMEFHALVNSLISHLPLLNQDKQLLLEAASQHERVQAFTAILEQSPSKSDATH